MTDAEKIDFLGGEVDALLAFASAMIKTHPNLQALDGAFTQSKELQAASALASTASEAFLQGQEQVRERIKQLFMAAYLQKGA
jgi:hypothetical protein